jgi:hypothetical protein
VQIAPAQVLITPKLSKWVLEGRCPLTRLRRQSLVVWVQCLEGGAKRALLL